VVYWLSNTAISYELEWPLPATSLFKCDFSYTVVPKLKRFKLNRILTHNDHCSGFCCILCTSSKNINVSWYDSAHINIVWTMMQIISSGLLWLVIYALVVQSRKPLLKVAQTTLRLLLLIYGFKFKSTTGFSNSTFSFGRKRNVFLMWPCTLTLHLDLRIWPTYMVMMKHCVKYLGQRSFRSEVIT